MIRLEKDTILLDTLSVVPGSIVIEGLPDSAYWVDYPSAKLKIIVADSTHEIKITYRVFPINFTQKISHRDANSNRTEKVLNPYLYKETETFSGDIFGENNLQKGGSISRGINFGNTRDMSVSSDLNLQLSGKIQDVEILAAVTDNSIPIQPEGNTQQLQDFDKVFVQFSKNGHQLIAGDFQLLEQKDQFLRYNKKAQGLSYSGKFGTKKNKEVLNTSFSAALSRGKFARNVIVGQEGNQGPYKLKGNENEQYIIILSGTEKVFLDGALLKRGMEHDYVIDYNTGELTFTTKNLITKDKRIVVEFQYSDRNYGRTLFSSNNQVRLSNKIKLHFNLYSEQDMKYQQLLQTLSQDDINLLAISGDSLDFAVTPHVDSVEYSSSRVLYAKADSLVGSTIYTYYFQSNDPTIAYYQLNFSFVGSGKGNYIQDKSTANGRVFKWVAPVNNVPQGSFEPVVKLISPKQKQMATLAFDYKKDEKNGFFVETALSNDNKNLFSDKDKADDQGMAVGTRYFFAKALGKNEADWEVVGNQTYQFIHQNFSFIERFRSTEFERDWSLSSDLPGTDKTDEHLIALDLVVKKKEEEKLKISSSYLNRGSVYQGYKNDAGLNLKLWKGALLTGKGSYLSSDGTVYSSTFLRHQLSLTQNAKFLSLKIYEQDEQKKSYLKANDSLLSTTFNDNFKIYGAQISSLGSELNTVSANYSRRFDYLPKNHDLKMSTQANDYGFTFQNQNKNQTRFFRINTTLRELFVVDTTLSLADPENTLLNRLEFNFSLFKGMINSSSFYEIGTGNELKREFSYVEVPPGQGIYAWNDYNEDAVQQLNEFEIAQFSDQAKFIRVYLTTNEFVKTFTNQINQSFTITPSKYFKRDNGFKKLITRFSDQAFVRLDQKNSKDNNADFNLPFSSSVNDTGLISMNSSYRNTLYFNRSNPVFGLDYSISDTRNKSLLINGFDARQLFLNTGNVRLTVLKYFTFLVKVEQQEKSRSSEIFSADDYHVVSKVLEPKIQFQSNSTFRFTLQGAYKDKRNDQKFGGETSIYQKIGFETTYAVPGKGRLNATFDYINNNYQSTDTKASPVQFELLEGLQPGTNFTWQLRYQQTFKGNLQANISYDGRSSPGTPVVHTASVQVQMLF